MDESPPADRVPGVGDTRRRTLKNLEGRRIVVLGGTGGIGAAVVHALLERGAAVLATGRDPGRLEEARRRGGAVLALELSDPQAATTLASAVERHLGGVDGLVAAAGTYGPIGPTRAVDLTALRASLEENLLGPMACLQALAPALDLSPDPSVVLFSGGGATGPLPRYAAYAMAKVATVRLVESLALEEPRWRVNAVAPGFVATRIHDATRVAGPDAAGAMFADTERESESAVPPESAAALVVFLLSSDAAGITGRLVSAVWDPWQDAEGGAVLREHPTFGRLRRVDGQRIFDSGA